MKRRLLLFVFIVLIATTIILTALNIEYREAISVRDFQTFEESERTQDLKILGKLSYIASNSFSIADIDFPENTISYSFNAGELNLENYAISDTVLVSGIYLDNYTEMQGTEIQRINQEDASKHLARYKPMLSISITDYKKSLEDPCESLEYKLKLTNTGKKEILHKDILDEKYGYTLVYTINGKDFAFFEIEDFDKIEPTEEVKATVKNNNSIKSTMVEGNNEISFSWGQKSLYDEEFKKLSSSETVSINILNNSCE